MPRASGRAWPRSPHGGSARWPRSGARSWRSSSPLPPRPCSFVVCARDRGRAGQLPRSGGSCHTSSPATTCSTSRRSPRRSGAAPSAARRRAGKGPVSTARDRPPEEGAEDTSCARGLRVLLMIADRGEIRADELSSLLDTPVSTIYRYLRTLAGFCFVDRHDAGYRLGPRLIIGSGANITAEELIRTADPVLRLL